MTSATVRALSRHRATLARAGAAIVAIGVVLRFLSARAGSTYGETVRKVGPLSAFSITARYAGARALRASCARGGGRRTW